MKTVLSLLLSLCAISAFAQNNVVNGEDRPTGVYQRKGCCGITFTGCRSSGTVYIIDGVQIRQLPVLPPSVSLVASMKVPGTYSLSKEEVARMPYNNIRDMASTLPGVYQQRRGDELLVYGSR